MQTKELRQAQFRDRGKSIGEVDWSRTHAKVYCPRGRGHELRWVKISSGDHLKGVGVIDDFPRTAKSLKFGVEIVYAGGTDNGVRPKMVRRRHTRSQRLALIRGVEKQLELAMTFKP